MATLAENAALGSVVTTLDATDADSGANSQLVYSIVDGGPNSAFQIDSSSGVVRVQRSEPLDFEVTRAIFIQVQVEDMGTPVRSSRAAVGGGCWFIGRVGIVQLSLLVIVVLCSFDIVDCESD